MRECKISIWQRTWVKKEIPGQASFSQIRTDCHPNKVHLLVSITHYTHAFLSHFREFHRDTEEATQEEVGKYALMGFVERRQNIS